MRKARINWSIKHFNKEMEDNNVSFDYPIQRTGGQWDDEKKSLLIHSLATDFPVPPLYAVAQKEIIGDENEEKEILYILDGKQRSTNIKSFINGEFRLHEDVPPFKMSNGKVYHLAKYNFEELPSEVQEAIQDFTLDIFKLEDADDDIIEDVFYRLNNGVSLSTQQKAKAKLGAEMALRLKDSMEHPLMIDLEEKDPKKGKQNAVFTELQRKQAQDEVALVQSMMLIDDKFQVGKFGTQDVSDYTVSLRGSDKEYVLENLKKALDLLREVFGEGVKEKHLLKKINFPFVVYASHQAVQKGLSADTFKFWIDSFREKLLSKENGEFIIVEDEKGKKKKESNPNAWLYKIGSGAGATKAEKVAQRLKATDDDLEAFFKELEDENKEAEREKAELERLRIEREKREKEETEKKATQVNEPKDKKPKARNNSQKPKKSVGQEEQVEQGKLEV